jgi:hypothetical protein
MAFTMVIKDSDISIFAHRRICHSAQDNIWYASYDFYRTTCVLQPHLVLEPHETVSLPSNTSSLAGGLLVESAGPD